MINITKKQIVTLVELQKIYIETVKLEARLQDMPTRISALDEKLEEFARRFKDDEAFISELNKKYRTQESDVQLNLEKIQKSQEKLRAVKTNKEYQSSLKEIEDLKTINSKIEDMMLETLEKIDKAEIELNQREQYYSEIVDETNREKDSISQAAEQSKKRLLELKSNRSVMAAGMDAELLDIFSRQRLKQADRVAIVEVKDGVCRGCNMNIPPQLYNELQRHNNLINCPSCERLIYWEDDNERSE